MDESMQIIKLADTERVMKANIKEAITLLEPLGEKIKDDAILSYDYPALLKRLGICYFDIGQTEKARENLGNALALAKRDCNYIEIADIRTSFAFLEMQTGTLEKAQNYAKKAWRYIDGKKGEKFTSTKANTAEILGKVSYEQGEYDDALDMFNYAAEQARKIGFVERLLTAKLASVKYYVILGKIGKAQEHFDRYFTKVQKGYDFILPQYLMVQAQIALADNRVEDALDTTLKAYKVFKKHGIIRLKAECAQQLASLYAQKKAFVKADSFSREALDIYNEMGLNFPTHHPKVKDWFTTFDDLE